MSTPIYTDQQLLDLTRAAIAAVMTGQSYTANGKQLTRADLTALRETEKYYELKIAAATSPTGSVLVQFGQPQ